MKIHFKTLTNFIIYTCKIQNPKMPTCKNIVKYIAKHSIKCPNVTNPIMAGFIGNGYNNSLFGPLLKCCINWVYRFTYRINFFWKYRDWSCLLGFSFVDDDTIRDGKKSKIQFGIVRKFLRSCLAKMLLFKS